MRRPGSAAASHNASGRSRSRRRARTRAGVALGGQPAQQVAVPASTPAPANTPSRAWSSTPTPCCLKVSVAFSSGSGDAAGLKAGGGGRRRRRRTGRRPHQAEEQLGMGGVAGLLVEVAQHVEEPQVVVPG